MKVPKMTTIPSSKKVVDDEVTKSESGKVERTIDPRPEFSVNADEFPSIKGWAVGEKYMVIMEVEQVSSSIGEWGDDKGKHTARFKVNKIGSHDEGNTDYPKAMRVKKK